MFSREQFGQRLYEMRKKNHETQADLAAQLECVKSHLREMEGGVQSTPAEQLGQWGGQEDLSSDYLLGLSDDPSPR